MAARLTRVERGVKEIARALDARGRAWALVGGLAVSARAEPRTTRDVDVAVAVQDDADAERLVADLRGAGFEVLATVEQRERDRLATVRLGAARVQHVVVDLLFASSGIESEVVRGAERLDLVSGMTVPIASVGHLIALKILSREDDVRPQDAVDLRHLIAQATNDDLATAREACRAISERGFARGRDLDALLDTTVRKIRVAP